MIRERFHRCSRCHETLARSFYVLHKPTGGYAGVCKQCQEENRKAQTLSQPPLNIPFPTRRQELPWVILRT